MDMLCSLKNIGIVLYGIAGYELVMLCTGIECYDTWYGMVIRQHAMVWYVMVQYGRVWYGMVCNGMECYDDGYGMIGYGKTMVCKGIAWYGMQWWYGVL